MPHRQARPIVRKPMVRFAAGLIGGLLAALTVAPLGLAYAETAQDVKMSDEAWFFRARQPLSPVPDIDDPTGNQPDDIAKATLRDRTNPYPPETLHVGVAGGEGEAVTYIALPLFDLAGGIAPEVTGGTVTFTDAGATCANATTERTGQTGSCGSRRPEAADMVGCAATELVVAAQGGDWQDQYDYDKKLCAPLKMVEGSNPLQWKLDLAPFKSLWSDPLKNYGLAIVPNPETISGPNPQQTWHVAFHANSTNVADAKLIVADLEYIKPDVPTFDTGSGGGVPAPPLDTPPATGGDTGISGTGTTTTTPMDSGTSTTTSTAPISPTTGTAPPPDVASAESAPQASAPVAAPAAAAPATTPAAATGPQTPKSLWLLPLLGLSLAGALGWSLSQPVELVTERQGAVSKLMRARRLSSSASA
jgi:hypothetical protein